MIDADDLARYSIKCDYGTCRKRATHVAVKAGSYDNGRPMCRDDAALWLSTSDGNVSVSNYTESTRWACLHHKSA